MTPKSWTCPGIATLASMAFLLVPAITLGQANLSADLCTDPRAYCDVISVGRAEDHHSITMVTPEGGHVMARFLLQSEVFSHAPGTQPTAVLIDGLPESWKALSRGMRVTITWDPSFEYAVQIQAAGTSCRADLDGNANVDVADLSILLAQWGPCPPHLLWCSADFNRDRRVDIADQADLLAGWGKCR